MRPGVKCANTITIRSATFGFWSTRLGKQPFSSMRMARPLTTIHTPAEFMGEYAAHYILLRTKEDSLNQQTPIRLTLPCNLIVRNSCAAPRKQS